MTDSHTGGRSPADLLSVALDTTARTISAVRPDRWCSDTPCSEWNVRDVVNHLTNETLWVAELLAGKTIAEVGDRLDGDLVGDDPVNAYSASTAVAKKAVNEPGAMEVTCHLSFGDVPGHDYVLQIFMDTLVHGWDIAVGSGQAAVLPTELVEAAYPVARQIRTDFGASGVIGDNLEDPSDDLQFRLLGLLGRRSSASS